MDTVELLENLLFSALFPKMDRWRSSSDASRPPDEVLRVFTRVELRLQQRYGYLEFVDLVTVASLRAIDERVPGLLEASPEQSVDEAFAPHLLFAPNSNAN